MTNNIRLHSHRLSPKSVRGITSPSATLLIATCSLVELNPRSSIALISLLFITFSCNIVNYTHIRLKLLIMAVPRIFCQAPCK